MKAGIGEDRANFALEVDSSENVKRDEEEHERTKFEHICIVIKIVLF